MSLPLDVGAGDNAHDDWISYGITYIDATNPANLAGILTTIDMWLVQAVTNQIVGVFRPVSGSNSPHLCIAIVTFASLGSGKNTKAITLPVIPGDRLGFYNETLGSLYNASSGGSGFYSTSGNKCVVGLQSTFAATADVRISALAQGICRGWASK